MKKSILISTITAGFLFTACGGGGGSDSKNTQDTSSAKTQTQAKVAYLVDAPIVGATYLTDGQTNFTKSGGSFKYENENISFYLGDIHLGSINKIPDDKIVMLQDVLGIERNDLTNERLIKAATLIQSLDANPNTRAIELKKGILKGDEYKKSIDNINVDKILSENKITKKNKFEVAKHLRETLDGILDTSLPNLETISPLNGQKNISLNTQIELKFSKIIYYDTFLNKISIKSSSGENIEFNTYLNENIMILKPIGLKKSTQYTINIDGVKDYNSNEPKKISFSFTTASDESAKADSHSGGSPVVEEGHSGQSTGGSTSQSSGSTSQSGGSTSQSEGSSAVDISIQASEGGSISWDKATVFDAVGKIEDTVDLSVVKQFGITKFGNDLATSERVVSLDGKNNFAVVGSKYHNALNVIDYNQGTYNYTKFASFRVNYNVGRGGLAPSNGISGGGSSGSDGSAGGSSSGGIDGTSGASGRSISRALYQDESCSTVDRNNPKSLWEHSLKDAKITSNGEYVYALILPRFSVEEYSATSTFGLFRTKVGYCGVNPYNASSTNKVDSRGISQIELSDNDRMLAVYGTADSQNILRVYNPTLTSVMGAKVLDNLASFDFAFNDQAIVGAISQTYTQKAKLVKYGASNLNVQIEKNIPFSADTILGANNKVIALSKSKGLVGLFDSSLNMLKEIKVNFTATKTAISPNGAFLALGNSDSIHVYDISNSSITKLTTSPTNGLRALSFVNNSLLAYTPKNSANSVVTLKLQEATQQSGGDESGGSVETLSDLGNFTSMSSVASTNIFGKTKLITSSGNRVLSYTQLAPDDKGYNVFDITSNSFKFTEGSKSSVDKFYRDEVMQMKLLNDNSFVVVSVNHNYPAFSSIYTQKVLDDDTLEDSYNTKALNSISIGNYGTPQSAKIAKDTNTIFVTKKALTQNYYLVDIYKKSGDTYSVSSSDIALEHLTTSVNSVAPTDDGNDFYSLGEGKVYQNSTNKSVDVKNANGVFYGAGLVLVTTSDGKLYSFDKDLASKTAYKSSFTNVKNMQTSGNSIVVFTQDGVYTLKVENKTLKAGKSLGVSNLVGGYVNGNRVFAVSNSAYSPTTPNTSDIIYATF